MRSALFLAVVLALILAAPALAQESAPPQPADPGSLQETALALMAALASLLGAAAIDSIKRLPFLTDGDKSKLAGPTALLVSVVVNIAAGYVVALGGQAVGLIDDAGLQALLVAIATPILAELRYRLAKLAPTGQAGTSQVG